LRGNYDFVSSVPEVSHYLAAFLPRGLVGDGWDEKASADSVDQVVVECENENLLVLVFFKLLA
jgi:hypothetical protein